MSQKNISDIYPIYVKVTDITRDTVNVYIYTFKISGTVQIVVYGTNRQIMFQSQQIPIDPFTASNPYKIRGLSKNTRYIAIMMLTGDQNASSENYAFAQSFTTENSRVEDRRSHCVIL